MKELEVLFSYFPVVISWVMGIALISFALWRFFILIGADNTGISFFQKEFWRSDNLKIYFETEKLPGALLFPLTIFLLLFLIPKLLFYILILFSIIWNLVFSTKFLVIHLSNFKKYRERAYILPAFLTLVFIILNIVALFFALKYGGVIKTIWLIENSRDFFFNHVFYAIIGMLFLVISTNIGVAMVSYENYYDIARRFMKKGEIEKSKEIVEKLESMGERPEYMRNISFVRELKRTYKNSTSP